MQRLKRIILSLLVIFIFTSCAIKDYVPNDKLVLIDNQIDIDTTYSEINKSDISNYIIQKPSSSLFNWQPRVWIYYKTINKKDRSFYRWLNQSFGKAPIYYDNYSTLESQKQITNYLNDIGFFNSIVTATKTEKKKRAKVIYNIKLSSPYIIENKDTDIDNTLIEQYVTDINDELPVQCGKNFNAFTMNEERDLITNHLRNNGFYTFTQDNIIFEVDTSFNSKIADITLKINGNNQQKYYINDVFIYPDNKKSFRKNIQNDTTRYVFSFGKQHPYYTFYFVHDGDPKIKYKTFNQVIQIHSGEEFSQKKVTQTYSALGKLSVYNLHNISFDTIPSDNDSIKLLNCNILLQKGKLNSFNIQIEGTNSGGNLGSLGSISFKNNNIFRGSEVLNIKIQGGFQFQNVSKEIVSSGLFNNRRFGVEARILFPRFLSPFRLRQFVIEYQPRTNLTVGYDLAIKALYSRYSATASFGYNWMSNNQLQHILNPINLNSVKVNQTPLFQQMLSEETNQRIKDQYTSHLILGINYSLIFSNQNIKQNKDFFYIRADIETSGNLLSLFNNTPIVKTNSDGSHDIFGIVYSQFVRLGLDFRYYHYFNKSHIAFRAMGGWGIPYGNSKNMPFEKNYYSGGTNSMRGWGYRELGPGGFHEEGLTKIERNGNILLEFNAEYRFPLYGILKGAVFTDVGNIWNSHDNETFTDGKFDVNTFYKQLAMDVGCGLRLDISFLLLRFDIAIPTRDPQFIESERWRIKKWQWDDLVFNFGIGYPF